MTSITFFLIFIPLLAFVLLAVNLIFAPHNPYQEKDSAFECGFHSFLGQNRTQFSISFFIFALLFLLFDLEILLVYPYIVSAYVNGIYGLIIMLIFFLVLTLGFAFELGKNALKIDSRQAYSTLPSKTHESESLPLSSGILLGSIISEFFGRKVGVTGSQLIRFKYNKYVYLYNLIFVIFAICWLFWSLKDLMDIFNIIIDIFNNPYIILSSLLLYHFKNNVFSMLTYFLKDSKYYKLCCFLIHKYGLYKGVRLISIGLYCDISTKFLINVEMCINLTFGFAIIFYILGSFAYFMLFFSLFLVLILSIFCLIYINYINLEFKNDYPWLYFVLCALLISVIILSSCFIVHEINKLIHVWLGYFINMEANDSDMPNTGPNQDPGQGPGKGHGQGPNNNSPEAFSGINPVKEKYKWRTKEERDMDREDKEQRKIKRESDKKEREDMQSQYKERRENIEKEEEEKKAEWYIWQQAKLKECNDDEGHTFEEWYDYLLNKRKEDIAGKAVD